MNPNPSPPYRSAASIRVGWPLLGLLALASCTGNTAKPMAAPESVAYAPEAAADYRHISPTYYHNTESYAHIEENGFQLVSEAPLSTFSIDVDRASYANVRRFIEDGQRPPVDAVRIEEMINYFPYEWEEAAGEHPFAVTTEVWEAPWRPEHRLVRIGLTARSVDTQDLPPGNLVFLPGGDRSLCRRRRAGPAIDAGRRP